MKIEEIKKKMLNWRDFLGGEIIYDEEINRAKNKKELCVIMEKYICHLEEIGNDMVKHAEDFKKRLKLTD